ncbi:SCAN domain-containing protein 3-like [Montipora foliosa]|uniref:SCAN domain-containing protein 3-like n=1 Tax=Montipora foliosa TaxID=591990 RepID=UPI0035F18A06
MASNCDDSTPNCVHKMEFLSALDSLKEQQKTSKSEITLFADDNFFERATTYLVAKKKKNSDEIERIMTKSESQLHENLLFARNKVAHRGREKTEHWVKQNFAEVSQRVINLFESLCRLHAERKPITSRIKEVTNLLQARSFLSMLEIDLMDFRDLPCTCRNPDKWVINLIDHQTKFVNSHPLHAKSADEVLDAVKNYCLSYGYPQKILTDNGGEFCNAKLKLFCEENQINLSHGAARTPTTQGLVERSNTTWKENMRSIIMGSYNKNIERWCEYTMQASYTMKVTLHRAINTTPYEVVFGITAHRENHQNTDEDIKCEGETTELASGKNTLDNDQCETFERATKRQKIFEQQSQYNEEMVKQTSQSRKTPFKIDYIVQSK